MSHRRLVRRPDPEPRSEAGADLSAGWRQFVLDQVGYDEVARERSARQADRREAFRRFLNGVIGGLALFALAFAVVLAALSWREGRFDPYLPEASAPADVAPPHRVRVGSPDLTESRDDHVMLSDPAHPAARTSASPADTDDGDSSSSDAAPSDGGN